MIQWAAHEVGGQQGWVAFVPLMALCEIVNDSMCFQKFPQMLWKNSSFWFRNNILQSLRDNVKFSDDHPTCILQLDHFVLRSETTFLASNTFLGALKRVGEKNQKSCSRVKERCWSTTRKRDLVLSSQIVEVRTCTWDWKWWKMYLETWKMLGYQLDDSKHRKTGCLTKHPLKTDCLEFQVGNGPQ